MRGNKEDNVELYPNRGKNKQGSSVLKIVLRTAIIASLAAILLMVGTWAFLRWKPLDTQSVETAEGLEDLVVSPHTDTSYILVIGLDKEEDMTDIMMVVCLDHRQKTMSMLQIPRDLYIGDDIKTSKINAVYSYPREGESRVNALRRRLSKDLGIPIDNYVTFTLEGFRNIVDTVGGVEVNIRQAGGIKIEDHTKKYTWIRLEQGEQTLDGIKAEGFIRKRYAYGDEGYDGSDSIRAEQQRLFYASFAKKMKEISLPQVLSFVKSSYKEVATDLSVGEMLGLAEEVREMDMDKMEVRAVPGGYLYYEPPTWNAELSFFSIFKKEYAELFNEYFNP